VNPDTAANRGYAAEGTEALSYSLGEASPPDLFEAFNVGREILPEDEDEQVRGLRGSFLAPNLWPTRPAEFRATWLAYWAAMEELACTLMSVAAVGLGLDEDYFQPMIDRSISVMRAINYERSPGAPDMLPGQMRMGAHSDYGSLTILLADDVPGLEIRLADGSWQPVPIPAGGFVVNIGDLLAEWTNDRWRSTVHRVVPPPVPAGDDRCRRRSVAWFQQPDHDAVVECLPTCTGPGNPPRYRPVRSGDHLMAKLLGPRLLRPSERSPGHVEE
jgi:isopenicillin N synthase-like dioxygenase